MCYVLQLQVRSEDVTSCVCSAYVLRGPCAVQTTGMRCLLSQSRLHMSRPPGGKVLNVLKSPSSISTSTKNTTTITSSFRWKLLHKRIELLTVVSPFLRSLCNPSSLNVDHSELG